MKEGKLDKGLINKGGLRSNSPPPKKNPTTNKKTGSVAAQAISEAKKSEVELILKKIIRLHLAGLVCKARGQTRAWGEMLKSPAAHKAAPTPTHCRGLERKTDTSMDSTAVKGIPPGRKNAVTSPVQPGAQNLHQPSAAPMAASYPHPSLRICF